MAGSFSRIIIHLTICSYRRAPFLNERVEAELYSYLGGTINGLGGKSITVNGWRDHVHMLFHLPSTHALSDFIRELKKTSGKFIREHLSLQGFQWQKGYGAFSVDHHAIERTANYIRKQHEHHQAKSSREEYRGLLEEYGVPFDPRYLEDEEEEEEPT